ncbi:ABC transporter ATP-binding protein [archaeon]|nr:ABC transporter ATP-binding protein [archaeon]MBT3450883.1 ABC transporter ATP-binding protein [archaeon]MBT6869065.1 ABC transporter ATP-binding protein [archaeon]MBT7193308.1 ABC transporter ATP-binding protein [archaeon]MBT7380316.1 ABC transporter ATP-binding protein [archaeon]
MELLRLKGVTKEFGSRLILSNVNMVVEEGDIFGIIGKSGSGKSTLLNLIVGFSEPDEGQVLFYSPTGQCLNLKKHHMKIRKKIGFTPQHLSFYPKLTVKENVLHFGRSYGIRDNILVDNAKNILDFMGLLEYKNFLAEELSGGMQRRLDLACSLIHKPKLLVLDEPITDLDPGLRHQILELIKEVNKQGVTVIIASHDLDNMELICNKIAIVNEGKFYYEGKIDEIRKPFLHQNSLISLKTGKYHDLFLEYAKRLPIKKIIDCRTHILLESDNFNQTVNAITSFIDRHGLTLNQMEISQPSLKTIFETITKDGGEILKP